MEHFITIILFLYVLYLNISCTHYIVSILSRRNLNIWCRIIKVSILHSTLQYV